MRTPSRRHADFVGRVVGVALRRDSRRPWLLALLSSLALAACAGDVHDSGGEVEERAGSTGVHATFPTAVFDSGAGPRTTLWIHRVGGELRAAAEIGLADGGALFSGAPVLLTVDGDVATYDGRSCRGEIRRSSVSTKLRFSGECELARRTVEFDSVLSERADDVLTGRWRSGENDPVVDVFASDDEGITTEITHNGRVIAPRRRHAWTALDAVELRDVLDLGGQRRCELSLGVHSDAQKLTVLAGASAAVSQHRSPR